MNKIISRLYKNFNWIITWEITRLCNLNCSYCFAPKVDDHSDSNYILGRIVGLRPKLILITGGEPLLVDNLEYIIHEIKNKIETSIIINTNATLVNPLIKLLDYIDGYDLSIDGLGEVNEKTRGINGDMVIEHIERLAKEIEVKRIKKLLNISTVVTKHNFLFLPELVKKLNELVPKIQINCLPMIPYDHLDSIASDSKNYVQFADMVDYLFKAGFHIRVLCPFSRKGQFKEIYCYRQYFRASVSSVGDIVYCKPQRYLGYLFDCLTRKYSRRPREAMSALKKIFPLLAFDRYNSFCPFPCACDDYLDKLFFNEVWAKSYQLISKIPDHELRQSGQFIVKYINPKFDPEYLIANKNKPEFVSESAIFYDGYDK